MAGASTASTAFFCFSFDTRSRWGVFGGLLSFWLTGLHQLVSSNGARPSEVFAGAVREVAATLPYKWDARCDQKGSRGGKAGMG